MQAFKILVHLYLREPVSGTEKYLGAAFGRVEVHSRLGGETDTLSFAASLFHACNTYPWWEVSERIQLKFEMRDWDLKIPDERHVHTYARIMQITEVE